MPVSTPHKIALEQFCTDWNALGMFPTLYPMTMVHQSLARQVALAQSEVGPQGALPLPDDSHDASQVTTWIKTNESHDDDADLDAIPLQLFAVDRRGRIGLLDVELSLGKKGYDDGMTRIKVNTLLSGHRLRNTWMDPSMFRDYRKMQQGENADYRLEAAEERIKLFQKAMQAMIKDKIRDAEESQKKAQQQDAARQELQALIDLFKSKDIPVQDLVRTKRLSIDTDSFPGSLTYQIDGLSLTLMGDANPHEKDAAITVIQRFER